MLQHLVQVREVRVRPAVQPVLRPLVVTARFLKQRDLLGVLADGWFLFEVFFLGRGFLLDNEFVLWVVLVTAALLLVVFVVLLVSTPAQVALNLLQLLIYYLICIFVLVRVTQVLGIYLTGAQYQSFDLYGYNNIVTLHIPPCPACYWILGTKRRG